MTKIALPFVLALLLTACGQSVATSSVTPSQLPPAAAFECVMKEFETLRFQRTMYDKDELRTSARRENPKITFSNTQFRKTWDRLDVAVKPGKVGSDVSVTGVTEAEYFSQNGKNYIPQKPSDEVKQASSTIQNKCAGSEARPAAAQQ